MKLLCIVWLFCLYVPVKVFSQVDFRAHEDSLKGLLRQITETEHDFERLSRNLKFKTYFEQVLLKEHSFEYPFDSLTTVSRLKAPDGSFRIITWYVPLDNSQFEYFGFFQSEKSRGEGYELFTLTDQSENIENLEFETLDHENWYGTYYTDLIHKRHQRKDYYILLGWRGDNPLTRKRTIEPLRIRGRGRPSFGEPVFRYKDNRHRRIIFEYSARVSMTIRYEAHPVEGSRRPVDLIIFDRLAPTHSFLQGHYQFYYPETNIFDGFAFDEGRWIFHADIDARNPRRRPVPLPLPPD